MADYERISDKAIRRGLHRSEGKTGATCIYKSLVLTGVIFTNGGISVIFGFRGVLANADFTPVSKRTPVSTEIYVNCQGHCRYLQ